VNVVVNHFLAATILQELRPSRVDFKAINVVMIERVLMNHEVWSLINVKACESAEENQANDSVDPRCHNGALAHSNVPNLCPKSQTKTKHLNHLQEH